ncbi:type 2 lanthipeptide synthetase LanM family protein [Paenibacillus sp. F4]|uniref:type 2 lanthipeptide synthetase LanM family protein n=1 Tax=Paenibacillus sp. F4 TaxID=357385 RepID=UPI000C9F2FDA|nr:type 2 lanthipeptide synthetase LanM family protein [Paenibacillus sp. F4]PNQ78182.1 type 2 lantipeptide synthetase LanM [Paenibacillus sp. F4]
MKEQIMRALFLHERKNLVDQAFQGFNYKNWRQDKEKTIELIDEWFKFALISTESKKEARFKASSMNEEIFGALIQSTENLKWDENYLAIIKEYQADWFRVLEEALKMNENHPVLQNESRTMNVLIRPFIIWARNQLKQHLSKIDNAQDFILHENTINSVLHTLSFQLTQIAGRSFVLELNIAKTLEELEGQTPEERFISFIEKKFVGHKQLVSFFSEYAVIARTLAERTMLFVNVIKETLDRYLLNRSMIIDIFSLHSSELIRIDAGFGDSHQQGRTVMRLYLANGQSFMYKPKPLDISLHFQALIQWFNDKGFSPFLQRNSVIALEGYGYEKFIEAKPCKTEEEIQCFYTRLGALLAIIYLLDGTDFHYENLIAFGEHPMLIDLETLFHNQVYHNVPDSADIEAQFRIRNSPLGTSLLPILFHQDDKGFGIELSGVNGEKQMTPYPVLSLVDVNTDNMRYIRKSQATSTGNNRPSLEGELKNAGDYTTEIVNGFQLLCSMLLQYRMDLLAPTSPLFTFKDAPVRIVLRSTQFYTNFLLESRHPDYGRDALNQENLLDRIWFSWLDDRIISSELQDLRVGDIPYFTSKPSSLDLWDSYGKCIKDVFTRTSMSIVEDRLKSLTTDSISLYSDWISSSIAGSSLGKHVHKVHDPSPNEKVMINGYSPKPLHSEKFLETARILGDELIKKSVFSPSKKYVTWIGMNLNYRGQLYLSALSPGLYDGTAGIALFLAYLGKISEDEKYTSVALAALETALSKIPVHLKFPSAFYGQASLLYILSHFENLLGFNDAWSKRKSDIINNLDDSVEEDAFFDLLGGSAGVIHVLLNEYNHTKSAKTLEVAIKYGEHLLKHGINNNGVISWISNVSPTPYVGFGHGSIGIASALFRLAAVTKKDCYYATAEKALAHLTEAYSPDYFNWIDHGNKENHDLANWCHGASGIGIGLTLCIPYLKSSLVPGIVHNIERAVNTTLKYGFNKSHCICHGSLGNIELLILAGQALNRPEWVTEAKKQGNNALNYYFEHGKFKTGLPTALDSQGLWLGLSGIGYQLMRLYSLNSLPSILSLQEPLQKESSCI